MEIFAGLESNCFAGCDGNFSACAWIAANAGFAWLYGEDAESSEFDAVSFNETLFHGLEDSVNGSFGLGPDEPGSFYDPLNQILFDQSMPPLLLRFVPVFPLRQPTRCTIS